MDEQKQPLKDALLHMGFTQDDVIRVETAVSPTTIDEAIEWLSKSNPTLDTSQQWPTVSEKVSVDIQNPSYSNDLPSVSVHSSILPNQPTGGINNARNSLDRIDINRTAANSTPSPYVDPASNPPHDDDLRRAMELSQKEQDDRDLARAMDLSKREGATPVSEDPELIRALEESLKENQRLVGDRAVSWKSQAYADIKARQRNNINDPVGLRNIGNTCYLNSLLQVYYHLPDFRRAIMSFRAPKHFLQSSRDQKDEPQDNISKSTSETVCIGPLRNPEQYKPIPVAVSTPPCTPAPPSTPVSLCTSALPSVPTPNNASNTAPASNPALESNISSPPASTNVPLEKDTSYKSADQTEKLGEEIVLNNAVEFVVELQRLFAAMALGNQNCVDPTDVTRAMRDPEGVRILIGAQQDASEFNQLFLEIVEKGLSQDISEVNRSQVYDVSAEHQNVRGVPLAAVEEKSKDLVKDMFTVKFRQEISRYQRKENSFEVSRTEPLITNGETTAIIVDATSKEERNLHGGLEDYAIAPIEYHDNNCIPADTACEITFAGTQENSLSIASPTAEYLEVSEVKDEDMSKSCAALKSVWFTKLPPVVVIYLQRGSYNRETLQAEKVHDRYDFPPEITLDRYLERNREASARAREEVQEIRKEKKRLVSLLDLYRKFPMPKSGYSEEEDDNHQNEIDEEFGDTYMLGTNAETRQKGLENREEFISAGSRVRKRLEESLNPKSPLYAVAGLSKVDIEVSIRTITRVLDNDWQKVGELVSKLEALKSEPQAYKGLEDVEYLLHAVLVHDGAPDSGHYWTFIRDWNVCVEKKWMRLSDSTVSYVSEEEMFLWSAGGNGRASAYCLIYVAVASSGRNPNISIAEESRNLLPYIRVEEVEKVSLEYVRELKEAEKNSALQE